MKKTLVIVAIFIGMMAGAMVLSSFVGQKTNENGTCSEIMMADDDYEHHGLYNAGSGIYVGVWQKGKTLYWTKYDCAYCYPTSDTCKKYGEEWGYIQKDDSGSYYVENYNNSSKRYYFVEELPVRAWGLR